MLAGSKVYVSGYNFKPGPVTLTYYAGSTTGTYAGTVTAGSGCAFSNASVSTALIGGLLSSRKDMVKACDSARRCYTVSFIAKTIL